MPPERPTPREFLSAFRAGVKDLRTDGLHGARRALLQLLNVAQRRRYYGDREFHHRRLLTDFERFDPGLHVYRVETVNGLHAIEAIREERPDIVFVHGTSLIRGHVLDCTRAPFVNLHWGWSPVYRGEGIVSALALEGPGALGVTVHLIDRSIDSGPILSRARPVLDVNDNFYSIGVKLTILGTDLFLSVLNELLIAGRLSGVPQDRARSRLFSGAYLRAHPELYPVAWSNLRSSVGASSR